MPQTEPTTIPAMRPGVEMDWLGSEDADVCADVCPAVVLGAEIVDVDEVLVEEIAPALDPLLLLIEVEDELLIEVEDGLLSEVEDALVLVKSEADVLV